MESDGHGFRRLHPATLPLRLLRFVRQLVVPLLLVLFFARDSTWAMWGLGFAVVSAPLYEVWRYVTLRYRLGGDAIVLRTGLLFRSERNIPYHRIQNIDLVQGPVQRLLGVAEARIDTASGGDAEAELKVLSLQVIEEMRRRVFGAPADAALGVDPGETASTAVAEGDAGRVVLRLSTSELAKLGVIFNRWLALGGALLGLAWELGLLEQLPFGGARDVGGVGAAVLLVGALATALGSVAVLMVLSVARTITRFHDFRLERHGDDLRLECGLFTRRSATVPRPRIQFVSASQSLLHRWLDRVTVRVETAGGTVEKQDQVLSRKWLAPLVPEGSLPDVLAELREGLSLHDAPWQGATPRARRRMVRLWAMLSVIASILATAAFFPWGALSAAALVPLAVGYATLRARFMAWALLPDGIAFRDGVLTQRISATFFDKVQTAALGESPFDRRWGMSTLVVDTAGAGPAGHRIRVPYLERSTALAALARVADQAQGTTFRW